MKKRLKVLMVEDSLADSELILYQLKKGGIHALPRIVSTRHDFVKALTEFSPDIILSDFSMPAFDGLSALRISKKRCPEVPFVFVSGTIGEERAIEALKCGATDYILKDHLSGLVPKCKRALKEAKERIEKSKTEKQLKKSQRLLAEAQEVARLGNWSFDTQTEEVIWSDAVYSILGFDKSIKPSAESFMRAIHPDDVPVVEKIRKGSYITGKDFSYYCRFIRQDNSETRYIYVRGRFKAGEGMHHKVFGIMQDVTELKEAERQLKEINQELGTFIYKAHHDLRGPIASAIGLCNLALSEIRNDDQSQHYLKMIRGCVEKLDHMLHQLTDAMTIKDKKLANVRVRFEQVVNDVLESFKYMDGFAETSITCSGMDAHYEGDEKMMRSIFHNLIENAIRYRNVSRKKCLLSIDIKPAVKGIEITVSDNGIGIHEDIQPAIFDMFTRGHEESKGTGLGLYIVKNTVERLKGTIKVKSKPGEGSTFSIYLPY